MKVFIIDQARMTSTRLPGKVLRKVLDKTLLEYQIERLKRVKNADGIIIATTTNQTDDPIVDLCNSLNVLSYRGSELDVLDRYYNAASMFKADVIVRVTSDCPLIDPVIIDQVITRYLENIPELDYVSNTVQRSYPRGMDNEVFSYRVLEDMHQNAHLSAEREHVTPHIYLNPNMYSIQQVVNKTDLSFHRWTVDTPEDFQLIKNIIEALYPHNPEFSMDDVLPLFEIYPDWIKINADIVQKTI